MKKIREEIIDGETWTFYRGYDEAIINNHPDNGDNGMMMVLIESKDLPKVNTEHNNNYVAIYETPNGFKGHDSWIEAAVNKLSAPSDSWAIITGGKRGVITGIPGGA